VRPVWNSSGVRSDSGYISIVRTLDLLNHWYSRILSPQPPGVGDLGVLRIFVSSDLRSINHSCDRGTTFGAMRNRQEFQSVPVALLHCSENAD